MALSSRYIKLPITSSFNKLFPFHIFLQIDTPPGMELQSWYPVIKQEGDHVSQTHSFLHPRWVDMGSFIHSFNIYASGTILGPGNSFYSFRVFLLINEINYK